MGEETAIATTDTGSLLLQRKAAKLEEGKAKRIANLKGHAYKPGQSGNPKGRKPKEAALITKEARAIQREEVPMAVRIKLQMWLRVPVLEEVEVEGHKIKRIKMVDGKALMVEGEPLPKHLTYAKAKAKTRELAIFGLADGFNSFIDDKDTVNVDGGPTKRVEIVQEEADPTQDRDTLKKLIYGKFTEMAIERAREFNIALPGIQDLADEIGIGDQLGIPREEHISET